MKWLASFRYCSLVTTYTKSPVALHGWEANNLRVLSADILGSRSSKEIEVKNTAKGVVFEILLAVAGLVELHVHSVGVQKEHSVCSLVTTVVVVDRMATIQVAVGGSTGGVTVPESSSVVGRRQTERVTVFSQPVDMRVLREPGTKAQVLRLEDKLRGRSVKQHLIPFADGEGERLSFVVELEFRALARATITVGPGQDRLGHLVDLFIGIVNHHMETFI